MNTHKILNLFIAFIVALSLVIIPTHHARAGAALLVDTLSDSDSIDGYCSLREALLAANSDADHNECVSASYGDDTITFSVSGAIVLTSALPNLVSGYGSLAIDGAGQSILISGDSNSDGIGDVRVLYTSTGSVVNISNLTISHGYADRGGGISNNGALTLSHVTVNQSTASWGGGIYSPGRLTLHACVVSTNTASIDGAGLYNNHGTMLIDNGSIIGGVGTGNTAIGGASAGGIYNYGGTLTIDASTISQNTSANGAGGIMVHGGTATITNSTIAGNTAMLYSGGGIRIGAFAGTTTVTDTTISDNTAGQYGGGIYNEGNLMLLASTVSNNSSSIQGGGIWSNGPLTIQNGTTIGNGNVSGYGGGIYSLGTMTITSSTVSGNQATANTGGGVFNAFGGNATLDMVTVQSNTSWSGAGINNEGLMIVRNSVITQNNANYDGAGIYTYHDATTTVDASTISSNHAWFGGGFFNGGTLHIQNGTMVDANTASFGGGVHNGGGGESQTGVLLIDDSTVSHNSGYLGGGILNASGTLTINRSTFSSNSGEGGGILNYSGPVSITNATFESNTSGSQGGGISNDGGTLTIVNGTFAGNSAVSGGGIYNNSTASLKNTIVANSPSGGNCYGSLTDNSGNLVWGDTTCPGTNADPKLGALTNDGGPTQTMALLSGSAAIDAGSDTGCPATDQRGTIRMQGAHCDIGAYELVTGTLSPTDIFVTGQDDDGMNPMLFRVDKNGNVIWKRYLPFDKLAMDLRLGDRNLAEDAFYMDISYYGQNEVDGKGVIQKYDAYGNLVWSLPILTATNDWGYVSANPVGGGIYLADTDAGIYRIDPGGNILWGPLNYGCAPSVWSTWSVVADVLDGGAYAANYTCNLVLKVDSSGSELWRKTIAEPIKLNMNPVDGGVYVGTGGYARNTYRLDANGDTLWGKTNFPSPWTYPRTVSPVDGSIYIVSGWPSLLAKAAMDGTVLWSVTNDNGQGFGYAHYGLAADLYENYFYTGDGYWGNLGISKYSGVDGVTPVWHINPGPYVYTSDYGPVYCVWTGVPAVQSNQPPVADAGGPYTVEWGATVTLDGSGSSDLDNNIISYEWDLDSDGVYETPGVTVSTSFLQVGDHLVSLRVTDEGGFDDTDTATVTVTDSTPPVITPTVTGTMGGDNWYTSNVTVSWDVTDPESGIASSNGCDTTTLSADTAGDTLTCSAANGIGLSNATSVTIKIDKTPPAITWVGSINNGDNFDFGFVPPAPTCAASDPGAGMDGECIVTGYASTVGVHILLAAARDMAGNDATELRTYKVLAWTLAGFYQPVDMNSVYNTVKGGSTVPLKFEIFVGSTELTDTGYVKGLTYVTYACDATAPVDEIELTATGGTGLRYDPIEGQFIYNWKTPRLPGKCLRVTVNTMDDSSLVAYFKLK